MKGIGVKIIFKIIAHLAWYCKNCEDSKWKTVSFRNIGLRNKEGDTAHCMPLIMSY